MWKACREERNWTIQNNFLLFFQSLLLIVVLEGNALGQIFNGENEVQPAHSECPNAEQWYCYGALE